MELPAAQRLRHKSLEAGASPPLDRHIVQFYEDEAALYAAVGAFLAEGLSAGETGLVIATDEHRDAIYLRLASAGVDVSAATSSGQLVLLDARELLRRSTTNGSPHVERFREHVRDAIETLQSARGARLRIFGEVVDLLWRGGNAQAAIQLEEVWNDLAQTYPFTLLCAYAMGNFYRGPSTAELDAIRHQHGWVIEPNAVNKESPSADTDLLAKKAHVLQQELEQRRILERALRDVLADRRRAEQALHRDIEERRHVEAELRLAKDEAERANRAKSDFLAVMSHELRTPLNAIIGYEQLLSEGVTDPCTPRQLEHLTRIRRNAAHVLNLIDDVISVARVEAGSVGYRIEPVRVADAFDAIHEIVHPQAAANGVVVRVENPADLAVHADRDKLRQVLLNLVGNALKFTPQHGTILLGAAVDPSEPTSVQICVTDSGPGIPEDKLDLVFERFLQLEHGRSHAVSGFGLGLAISRDFARGMGGSLRAESRSGQGAIFTLTLPRAIVDAEA